MTSTRDRVTLTSIAFSAASRPFAGAVPSTSPPAAGMPRTTSQGIDADRRTGACEISGAVTFANCPCWGQFSVAVVWVTGSSGVATASTKPTRPATTATQRAILTSLARSLFIFGSLARSLTAAP